ncbi:MAG: HD domain-containing protein [Planctomycetota bacterium]|nr:HD domain-containing protein [Planctomycetota bacterium]
MRSRHLDSLTHDAIHGYLPFTAAAEGSGEIAERDLVDHPWVQRLRHIRQLQTAWWVFPTAEHTRFQHVLGAMHLAGRAAEALYPSLRTVYPDTPSCAYVTSLLRMAALLHDVGHGPFGHFFDEHFLREYNLTHETLGAQIIVDELGDLLRSLRRNPHGTLEDGETLEPSQIAWLIQRPASATEPTDWPGWLSHLRALLSGIYTVDNMDFVLRDAYMSGYNQRSVDVDRLLHYSFFTDAGLTIHDRGLDTLVRFMGVRAELFRTIYFHRTVRAIDLTLKDLFEESREHLFPGDPREHLDEYQAFTEASLFTDVKRWMSDSNPAKQRLGTRWNRLLAREITWRMASQVNLVFGESDHESASIFSDSDLVERKMRQRLEASSSEIPLRIDIARHIHRPHTRGPVSGQNFLYDSSQDQVRPLAAHELFSRMPISYRICRAYVQDAAHVKPVSVALESLLKGPGSDDLTNM